MESASGGNLTPVRCLGCRIIPIGCELFPDGLLFRQYRVCVAGGRVPVTAHFLTRGTFLLVLR